MPEEERTFHQCEEAMRILRILVSPCGGNHWQVLENRNVIRKTDQFSVSRQAFEGNKR